MLFLIRHGKTKANQEGRYLGYTDEDLTEEGKQEILSLAASGYYPESDIIFTSALKRCKTTAALIYPGKQLIEIQIIRHGLTVVEPLHFRMEKAGNSSQNVASVVWRK